MGALLEAHYTSGGVSDPPPPKARSIYIVHYIVHTSPFETPSDEPLRYLYCGVGSTGPPLLPSRGGEASPKHPKCQWSSLAVLENREGGRELE